FALSHGLSATPGRGHDVVAFAVLRHSPAGLAGVLVPALDCLDQPPPRTAASAFAQAAWSISHSRIPCHVAPDAATLAARSSEHLPDALKPKPPPLAAQLLRQQKEHDDDAHIAHLWARMFGSHSPAEGSPLAPSVGALAL